MAVVVFAVGVVAAVLLDGFARHYAGGHRDDGVAEEHDDGGDELAGGGDGCDVAVAHGGDGHHGPVDTAGYAGDGGVAVALYAIHGGPEDDGYDEDEHHEDENLHTAAAQRVEQEAGFVEETLHLEYAEDAQHTHQAQDREGADRREDQAKPGGEDGEEVDDAVEGEHVAPGFVEAVDAQVILEGEEDGEEPAYGAHGPGEPGGRIRHAFEHDGDDVDSDEYQQPDVELLAGRGVGFEDDGVDLLLGECAVAFGQQHGEERAVQQVAYEIDDACGDVAIGYLADPAYQGG